MFRKILLAYDGSDAAKTAIVRFAEFASLGSPDLHIVAVGRVPEYAETQDEVDEAREQAETFYGSKLEEAAASLKARGVTTATHMVYGKPSEQILHVAGEIKADLIILGVHPHHPLRRRVLGGTADKIVDHAECSVLVVR